MKHELLRNINSSREKFIRKKKQRK